MLIRRDIKEKSQTAKEAGIYRGDLLQLDRLLIITAPVCFLFHSLRPKRGVATVTGNNDDMIEIALRRCLLSPGDGSSDEGWVYPSILFSR